MPDLLGRGKQSSIYSKKHEFVQREIWLAAMDLFVSSGFDETTIDQIAAQANVSRRTFFRYFSCKEDVMAAMMKAYGAALIDALRDQPLEIAPIEALQAVVKRVARLAAESPYAVRSAIIAKRSPAARSAQLIEMPVIEDELSRVFATRGDGEPKTELTFRLLASITVSVTSLAIYTWLENQEGEIDHVVDQVLSTLGGICLPATKAPARRHRS